MWFPYRHPQTGDMVDPTKIKMMLELPHPRPGPPTSISIRLIKRDDANDLSLIEVGTQLPYVCPVAPAGTSPRDCLSVGYDGMASQAVRSFDGASDAWPGAFWPAPWRRFCGWLAQDMGLRQQTPDGQTDPDQVPEPPDEATTKPGDVIILGNHRLVCGNSGIDADVDKLLDGAKIHMTMHTASTADSLFPHTTNRPGNLRELPRCQRGGA
jgi:hypothetical protein